jgi:hypothetical protein
MNPCDIGVQNLCEAINIPNELIINLEDKSLEKEFNLFDEKDLARIYFSHYVHVKELLDFEIFILARRWLLFLNLISFHVELFRIGNNLKQGFSTDIIVDLSVAYPQL